MIASFSVMSLALDAQGDIVTTQRILSDTQIRKVQENFGLDVSTNSTTGILDVSVCNKGQNAVEISSLFIVEKSLPTYPVNRYDINYQDAFVTGTDPSNILDSQDLFMEEGTYDVKVISTLGTKKITELIVTSNGSSSNSHYSVLCDITNSTMGSVTNIYNTTNINNGTGMNIYNNTITEDGAFPNLPNNYFQSVQCDPGDIVLGGGFAVIDGYGNPFSVQAASSRPLANLTGWESGFKFTNSQYTYSTYAVCMDTNP